jgi:hypothetical protein
MKQAVYTATLEEEIEPGTLIEMTVNLSSDPYSSVKLFNIPVGLVIEDFETGDFENFEWVMEGTQPWQITMENVFEGIYSARSGMIGDEQNSVIMIEMDVAIDDSISFYRKVSCEDDPYNDNYDWLGFFIDDIEVARWDGEYGWSRVAYPVTAGPRTFKWVYNKDYSVAGGLDAAWIDNIIFPAIAPFVGMENTPGKEQADFIILPNPASDKAEIIYNMSAAGEISIAIYDLAGNRISMAYPDKVLSSGSGKFTLDTTHLSSGMYFCVLKSQDQRIAKKLIISR